MLSLLKALVAAMLVTLILSGTVLAHERRNIGKYQLVVGFITEPAVEGVKNGVDFRVTNTETNKPVEGVEQTLKVEIGYKETTKTMNLRTIFQDPGHYTTDLIPTAPGQYVFRFFGTIEGVEVNERFESGPGRFNDVASAQELQFPERLPEVREIAGVSRSSQQAALEAKDSASSARTLAIVAIIIGALGILSGGGAAVIVLRKR